MCDTWDNTFLSLAEHYKDDFFRMDTQQYFTMICKGNIIVGCWIQIYHVMVRKGTMDKFDDLPDDVRQTLWNDAIGYAPTTADEKRIRQLSKVIHAISTYIQL
jgi:hypothetical protein